MKKLIIAALCAGSINAYSTLYYNCVDETETQSFEIVKSGTDGFGIFEISKKLCENIVCEEEGHVWLYYNDFKEPFAGYVDYEALGQDLVLSIPVPLAEGEGIEYFEAVMVINADDFSKTKKTSFKCDIQ